MVLMTTQDKLDGTAFYQTGIFLYRYFIIRVLGDL